MQPTTRENATGPRPNTAQPIKCPRCEQTKPPGSYIPKSHYCDACREELRPLLRYPTYQVDQDGNVWNKRGQRMAIQQRGTTRTVRICYNGTPHEISVPKAVEEVWEPKHNDYRVQHCHYIYPDGRPCENAYTINDGPSSLFRPGHKFCRHCEDTYLRPIRGFPTYMIDRHGRMFNRSTGRRLKQRSTSSVVLRDKNKQPRCLSLPRLILCVWGDNPPGTGWDDPAGNYVVRHKDGNPYDNDLDNLEWRHFKTHVPPPPHVATDEQGGC